MSSYTLTGLLDLLWKDYVETNPPAQRIHDLFTAKGEKVINDHVAFRTYGHPKIDVDVLSKAFRERGYEEKGQYHFEKKKLFAKHFEHPDSEMPLIFISQLKLEEFDKNIRGIIQKLIDQIPEGYTADPKFLFSGRPWRLSYEDYVKLK